MERHSDIFLIDVLDVGSECYCGSLGESSIVEHPLVVSSVNEPVAVPPVSQTTFEDPAARSTHGYP